MMNSAYQSDLGSMDAALSSLYSNWKYTSAAQATKWGRNIQAALTKDEDNIELDEGKEQEGETEKQEGIELLGETPLLKEGGEWLGKRLGLTPSQIEAGTERVGQWLGEQGLNPDALLGAAKDKAANLLQEGGRRLGEGATEWARDFQRSLPRNLEDAVGRATGQRGGLLGDGAEGEGTEMEDLGGFGRGSGGAEFRIPQDYGIGEPVGDEPESFEGMSVVRSGSAAEDAAIQAEVDARNAARAAESREAGTIAERSGAYDAAPPRPAEDFDLDQAAEEVAPPSEGGGFDSANVPDAPPPASSLPPRAFVKPMSDEDLDGIADDFARENGDFALTLHKGTIAYEGEVDARNAAAQAAESAESGAEAAAEAAGEGAAEVGGEVAGEEAGAAALDAVGVDDAYNPLGWIALAVGAGLGIDAAVKGSEATDKAKAAAAAAASAAASAAARVPPPVAPLNFAGRYIAPVKSALAGL